MIFVLAPQFGIPIKLRTLGLTREHDEGFHRPDTDMGVDLVSVRSALPLHCSRLGGPCEDQLGVS